MSKPTSGITRQTKPDGCATIPGKANWAKRFKKLEDALEKAGIVKPSQKGKQK